MKRTLLAMVMAVTTIASAWAQKDGKSFETAYDLVAGENASANVTTVETYYTGAYFVYTASEATILRCAPLSCYSFSFYDADQKQLSPSYTSIGGVYNYFVELKAGDKVYVLAKLAYGDTGTSVSFTAEMIAGDTSKGKTADDPRVIEDGGSYWFTYYYAYMRYVAPEDGVLVLGYDGSDYGSSYTVDGANTPITYNSAEKCWRFSVEAGKTYDIALYTSSRSLFNINVNLTHPKQGDLIDNPFIMQLGDNTVPAAAGKYWYKYTNGEKAGFLTVAGDGLKIYARNAGYSYDNLVSGANGTSKIEISANAEVVISVDKATATADDGVLTASFAEPQVGETELNPIVITSSKDNAISVPAGSTMYYAISVGDVSAFLNAKVLSGWNSNSTCKMKSQSESYYSMSFYENNDLHYQATKNTTYIFQIFNSGAEELKFAAWVEEIAQGDLFDNPLTAVKGENTILPVGASTKYYSYTPETSCVLDITVPDGVAVTFPYKSWGYEYNNTPFKVEGNTYSYKVTAGTPLLFKLANVEARMKFTVTEVEAGPGESRSKAIEFDGEYAITNTPGELWLVYTAPSEGTAVITADLKNTGYYDYVYYYVNDEETRHDIASWNYDKNAYDYKGNTAVQAGDKIYLQIISQTNQNGNVVKIEIREPDPGEAPSNPIVMTPNAGTAVGAVSYGGSPKYLTFTTIQAGNVVIEANEYITISIYNADDLNTPLFSDVNFGGSYYGKFDQQFDTVGTYMVKLTYSYYGDTLQLSGSAFDQTPTQIGAIENAISDSNAVRYNLAGQRVSVAQKGIIIVDGKKTVIK